MSPTNNKTLAIRGVIWTSASKVIAITITFFVTPILLRSLGAEQYGIWSIVIALTGYYGLVNMGIGKASTKYIAQFDALGDVQSVRRVISTGMALFSLLAVVALVVAALTAWWFPVLFDLGDYPSYQARWVVMLIGLRVAVGLVGQIFSSGLTARKRFELNKTMRITRTILNGGLTIAVVMAGGGLMEMAMVILGTTVLFKVTACFLAIRVVGLPCPSPAAIDRATGKMLFRFGLLNLMIQAVRKTSTVGGSIILGLFVGPAAAAYYSVAESLTRKSLNLGKTFNGILMPFASQFDSQSDRYALRRLMTVPTRLLVTLSLLLTVILLILGKTFLALWISPEIAAKVHPIICILSLSLVIKLPINGLHSALVGMGRMTFLSRVALGEGITMLVLGLILTPLLGIIGMPWAIVAAQFLFSGLLIPAYACREIRYPLRRFAVSTVGPASLAALPALASALLLAHFLPAQHLLVSLAQIGLVCLITAVCAFFICLDAPLRAEILRTLARPLPGRSRKVSTAVHDSVK